MLEIYFPNARLLLFVEADERRLGLWVQFLTTEYKESTEVFLGEALIEHGGTGKGQYGVGHIDYFHMLVGQ